MDPKLSPPEYDPPQQEAAKKGSTPLLPPFRFYIFYEFRLIESLGGETGFLQH